MAWLCWFGFHRFGDWSPNCYDNYVRPEKAIVLRFCKRCGYLQSKISIIKEIK